MKIAVCGDTHFGAGLTYGKTDTETQLNSRILDYTKTLNYIINEFEKRQVELMIITGDVFETKHPTSAQLNAFSQCINSARDKGIEVVIVAGNHDQQRDISTTTIDIFNHLNIPDVSVYTEFGIHETNGFKFALIPYKDRRMVREKTIEDGIKNIQKRVSALLPLVSDPKIVIGHFMIGKPIVGAIGTFSVNELVLPLKLFSGFDAVIMGHVHKHMIMSKVPLIGYVGSMEKNSFNDKDWEKVSIIIDTDDIKKIEIIPNNVREFKEINIDYTENKPYKEKIVDKIITDIDNFDNKSPLEDTIVKAIFKLHKDDLYYVDQEDIKKYILSKNISNLFSMNISSDSSRQLRNKKITEDVSSEEAMTAFLSKLPEQEKVKEKLIEYAMKIIKEVKKK